MPDPIPSLQMLGHAERGFDVGPADVIAVTVELEPGSAGAPAHRHPGPVFGYVVRGEVLFELEGEPERIVRAGDAFWNPAAMSSTIRLPTTVSTLPPRSWRHWSARPVRRS
jgi:uncharacterized cupin superfamily protein